MENIENRSSEIPISVKADAYDQLCRAYIEAQDMNFSLFGRRDHGFNSCAEYVGYGFVKMMLHQGAVSLPKQEKLEI